MASSLPALRTRVVGALACQRDSYLQTLDSEVVSCVQKKGEPEKLLTPGRSNHEASSSPPQSWLIEFMDSVLFPEGTYLDSIPIWLMLIIVLGGGQPTDFGTISLAKNHESAPIPIQFVERQGLRCVYHSPQPLPVGALIRQEVDFVRRWDHMQQHTGQHLLSAIMNAHAGLETLSWSLGAESEMSYVEVPRRPAQDEIQAIQKECNEVIRRNLAITVDSPDAARFDRLPADYDKDNGVIRVISIGDLDRNTCCGTHLSQTSHLSLLLLHTTQTVRSTNCRLFFTAGERAINLSTSSISSLRSIARQLSSGPAPSEVTNSVQKLIDLNSDMKKGERKLLMTIAEYEGERLKGILKTERRAWIHHATGGLNLLNMVVSKVKDLVKEHDLVVLASGEEQQIGYLIVIGGMENVDAYSEKIKATVPEIKGGGKGGKWQGKIAKWQKSELEALKKLVES